jgi:hypothetical protein
MSATRMAPMVMVTLARAASPAPVAGTTPASSASKSGSVWFFHLFWCNWDHNQFTKRGQVVVTRLDWAEPVIHSSVQSHNQF